MTLLVQLYGQLVLTDKNHKVFFATHFNNNYKMDAAVTITAIVIVLALLVIWLYLSSQPSVISGTSSMQSQGGIQADGQKNTSADMQTSYTDSGNINIPGFSVGMVHSNDPSSVNTYVPPTAPTVKAPTPVKMPTMPNVIPPRMP